MNQKSSKRKIYHKFKTRNFKQIIEKARGQLIVHK